MDRNRKYGGKCRRGGNGGEEFRQQRDGGKRVWQCSGRAGGNWGAAASGGMFVRHMARGTVTADTTDYAMYWVEVGWVVVRDRAGVGRQ